MTNPDILVFTPNRYRVSWLLCICHRSHKLKKKNHWNDSYYNQSSLRHIFKEMSKQLDLVFWQCKSENISHPKKFLVKKTPQNKSYSAICLLRNIQHVLKKKVESTLLRRVSYSYMHWLENVLSQTSYIKSVASKR